MENLTNRTIADWITTEQFEPTTRKKIFLNECYTLKTNIRNYDLWITLTQEDYKISSHVNAYSTDLIECTHSDKLFFAIELFLSAPTCVEKILFLKNDDTIYIWTAISGYNLEENRRAVYEQEIKLMDFLSKFGLHFDFYLIEVEEVDEILSSGTKIIYDK